MKNEVYEQLRKLSKKILEQTEAPSLAEQLREAQMLYETLLIANYLTEQEQQEKSEGLMKQEKSTPLEEKNKATPTSLYDINAASETPKGESLAEAPPSQAPKDAPEPAVPPRDKAPEEEAAKTNPPDEKPASPAAKPSQPEELLPKEPKTAPDAPPKSAEKQPESVVQGTKNPSLNSRLRAPAIEIGLNDRIAFVKHLFEGQQEDFNRVLSQLNTMTTLQEAEDFIQNLVKPDYNWEDKEEYEARLMQHVYRKFGEE